MRIGVGLPNTIPGTPGRFLVDWAQAAEAHGFSTLSTIGRVVFPTHDELIALTAAAAVTERIGLFANVLIAPLFDPVVVARQTASLDQISNGRFTLGLGVGWRPTDFTVVGREYGDRGKRLDADVELMLRIWGGEQVNGADKVVSPRPTDGTVPLAFGGSVPVAFERVAKHGVGYTAGGASPEQVAEFRRQTDAAWAAAGRSGTPKVWALAYYGLGEDAEETAATYLTDYYGDWGPGMAAGMPKDTASLRGAIEAFEAAGADELLFIPTKASMDQLDGLADAVDKSRVLVGAR